MMTTDFPSFTKTLLVLPGLADRNQACTGPSIRDNIRLCVKLTEGSSYGCHVALPEACFPCYSDGFNTLHCR